jgi:ribosomal protein L24
MSKEIFKEGDTVLVKSGAFAGAQGAVADLSEFDSVMRIETADGMAFALLDTVQKVVSKDKPRNKPVLKR